MSEYIAIAKQYGNSVQFSFDSSNAKMALSYAKEEARNIFDYVGTGDEPTVVVKEIQEKD